MSLKFLPLTIANGASVSGAGWGGNLALVGVQMPAAWTAAQLTLQFGTDGDLPPTWELGTGFTPASTWLDLYDETGTEVTITTAAARYCSINPRLGLITPWVRLRSGTASAPVNQGASRVVTLVLRGLA